MGDVLNGRIARKTVPIEILATPGDTLSSRVATILNHSFPQSPETEHSLFRDLDRVLEEAFAQGRDDALLDVHRALFFVYESRFSHPLSTLAAHQNSEWLTQFCRRVESAWLQHEIVVVADQLCDSAVCENASLLCDWFEHQARRRTEVDDWLCNFLAVSASLDQFRYFLLADAPLNFRFYDALVLAAVHYSEDVKCELVRHLWEECGEGQCARSHTRQFSRTLNAFGLSEHSAPIWRDWRPYAGYNLYLLFGLNRCHYFKALGSLAMPELFDPDRDAAIVHGMKRLGFSGALNQEYFETHVVCDVHHGASWLENVIARCAQGNPEVAAELALGAALRMVAMRRYHAHLADQFGYRAASRSM